ncbi:MAG: penicillin-binding protein 1C [Victivallales bacterium]|nr:penicillin-binding protein 1C [Victivallales bacterium]
MKIKKRTRIWLIAVCATFVILGSAAWMAWRLAPNYCTDPFPELKAQTPCRVYRDRHGKLLYIERTYDYQWRFDIPLEDISQEAIDVILAAEDASFYKHNGVNLQAVARAAWQNLTNRRIISGASTISMQLVSIARPRKRSFKNKFIQAAEARKMEQLHSKREILTEYLNRIPFGGKIHGIQAASIYYFGLDAKDLNRAEASLLCGLPQRPNAYRPDKHPERARKRQKLVLQLMERNGFLEKGLAQEIYENEPLRLRDFNYPSALRTYASPVCRHYLSLARREARNGFDIQCAIDVEYTERIQHALQQRVQQLPGVRDAAAVLIDNKSHQVIALVGTLDFNNPHGGQVNAAMATRSAGSTLKPFIYMEAFDAGFLTMDTIVKDTPLRYGTYMPTNYNGKYNDKLRVAEALSQSLNTPVVRLVADMTPERIIECFNSLGLNNKSNFFKDDAKTHGLSIALGTMGHSLFDIVQAYTTIPNGGLLSHATFLMDSPAPQSSRIFTPDSCAMVTKILSLKRLPGDENLQIAWKTGTSNGNHDAWCFGYTPDYTLGVWFGNKNGKPDAALVGASVAAPALVDIFNAIYRDSIPSPWPDSSKLLDRKQLCAKTGLTATPFCHEQFFGTVLHSIPLRSCDRCGVFAKPQPICILSPEPNRYIADHDGTVKLHLRASPSPVLWYIDNDYVGEIPSFKKRAFKPGRHVVLAISPDDSAASSTVTFVVTK